VARIVLDTDVVSLYRAQRRGRPRPLNDTWIAACCIKGGLPLLTLNRRDFADFAEHDGLVLLSA
jgi:predicted nucleic acid-binding protein